MYAYASAGAFGSWWGVGAVAVGTLILIAIGVIFVAFCW